MDKAEPLIRAAFQRRPQDPRFRFVFCEFLVENGDVDTAEAVLLGGSESPSNSAGNDLSAMEEDDRFWGLRCRIAERRGDYESALEYFDRAASIRPVDKEGAQRKARLLQLAGRAEEAKQAYARSHILSKDELELWNLSRDLGVRLPTTAECERVAQLYESLQKTLQAEAWRRLAEQITKEAPPDSAP
jgi:tetratricopeptide (TPR) repeat protein